MTDDRSRRNTQDRSSGGPEIWEIDFIVLEFDVSEDEAREAVRRVGNNRSDVESYFRDRGRERTGRGISSGSSGQQSGRMESGTNRQGMSDQQSGQMEGSRQGTSGQQQKPTGK